MSPLAGANAYDYIDHQSENFPPAISVPPPITSSGYEICGQSMSQEVKKRGQQEMGKRDQQEDGGRGDCGYTNRAMESESRF